MSNVECCWTAKFDFAPWDTKRTLLIEPCGKRQLYSEGFGLGCGLGLDLSLGMGWFGFLGLGFCGCHISTDL